MMKTSWKRFLLLQLPTSALMLALAVQGLAFSLSDVPMLRNRSDELALAVLKDPTKYRVLLFGDSITRISTVRFSLGAPGEVGNLSAFGTVGLVASLLYLHRYLRIHPSPDYVVVALAPSNYHHENSTRVERYNLWHTFRQPDEREFLRTYVPGIDQRDWLPAILDVRERLLEPFLSFLTGWYLAPRIEAGSMTPNADAPVEFAVRAEVVEDQLFGDTRNLTPSAMNAEALRRLCDLSRNYGFPIDIVWPPMPPQLENMLTSSGALTELEARIRAIMEAGHCDFDGFTDFNKIRTYPNRAFGNDLTHLLGDGWERRYSADMREYLSSLRKKPTGWQAGSAGLAR